MLDDDEKRTTINRVGNGWMEYTGDDGTIVRMFGEFSVRHITTFPYRNFYSGTYAKIDETTDFIFLPKPGKIDDRGTLYTVKVPVKKTATVIVPKNQLINLDDIAEAMGMERLKYRFVVHDEDENRLRVEFEEK